MDTLSLASRASFLKPSPTLAMSAKAKSMQAAGHDVISLAAGEPDFNTPDPICEAAAKALSDGMTRYTPTSGLPALKEAIKAKLERENGVKVECDQIVVSCGAKHSLYNTVMALIEPGDEVILIAPYWMTYREQILLAGGTPVIVQTDVSTGFIPSADQIREKISSRTKAIIINSPSNPTGAVYPSSLIKEIASLAIHHGFWVIADEIYERLVYEGDHISIASLGHDIAEHTVTIGGCSKTYAMTGWRIGFSASPLRVAKTIASFQDQVTSNPTSFAQAGAITAFNLPYDALELMCHEYRARRDLALNMLKNIPGLSVCKPNGAFYLMPNVSKFTRDGFTDQQLAEAILENAKVATVPGSVFGGEGHLRLSYAVSQEDLRRACERLSDFFSRMII